MKKNFILMLCLILTILISNGIVYSQNIGYWEPTANIYKTSSIDNLSIADNGNIWAVAPEGIFYSTNNGDTWIKTTNNGLNIVRDPTSTYPIYLIRCVIEHPISGSIFAGGQDANRNVSGFFTGALFRLSSKDGEFWEKVLDLPNSDFFTFWDIVVKASGDIYVVGEGWNNGCNIYCSSDNGNTWIEKNKGLPVVTSKYAPNEPMVSFRSLALATDGTLYAAGWSGVYRLDDGVDTWVKLLDMSSNQITVSPDSLIFVAANPGVFKSTDKGVTWEDTRKGLRDGYHYNIVYNPVTNHIFIGKNLLHISTDLGESWISDISSNLPTGSPPGGIDNNISSLAVNPKTGMIFVSYQNPTDYRGIYRLKVTSKEDIEGDKGPTLLLENYPNPFNPITNIQYHLDENSLVTLKVYDIMGREIATLINNKMQLKGSYSSTFDGRGLSSGIYFYTLFANGKPYTQKMLITK